MYPRPGKRVGCTLNRTCHSYSTCDDDVDDDDDNIDDDDDNDDSDDDDGDNIDNDDVRLTDKNVGCYKM
jgi:hypothetical protein